MERRTIFSITFLSFLVILILLPIIQCQINANPNKPGGGNGNGKKPLAPGLNNGNNKNIENIKNQKNPQSINSKTGQKPDFKEMFDKLTPEQKQQILDRKAENQKIQEAEITHNGGVTDEVKPSVIEDPRTPQTKNPSACLNDDSFAHFQLDLENGAVPDFLFLTSSTRPPSQFFARFLSFHDNIKAPRIIEPNFFSYPWISKLNAKSYQSIFSNSLQSTDKSEVVGDFSSSYLFHPLTPKRIATQLPDMKIIIVLQNPIERAYQLYLDRVNDGLEFLTFEQIVQREFKEIASLRQTFRDCYNAESCNKNLCVPDGNFISHDAEQTPRQLKNEVDVKDYLLTSYLFRSIYDDIVERWLNAFPRENIYVITHEEFFKERFETGLKNITSLLGIPSHTFTREEKEEEKEMEEIEEEEEEEDRPINQPINIKTQSALCKFFTVYNNRLSKLLGRELPWNSYCEGIQNIADKGGFPNQGSIAQQQPFGAGGFVDLDQMKKPNKN